MAASQHLEAYREFRREILTTYDPESSEKQGSAWAPHAAPWHPIRRLRHKITAYRRSLEYHGLEILKESPHFEPYLRCALGIPKNLAVWPERWYKLAQRALAVLSTRFGWWRAQTLLKRVRTVEGRRHVFEHQIRHSLPGLVYFSPSLDFVLRRLPPPLTFEGLRKLPSLDLDWTRVAYRLGLRTLEEIYECVPLRLDRVDGEFVLMLIDEGGG